MIFGYESLCSLIRKNSEEKVEHVVYANWFKSFIFVSCVMFVLGEVFFVIFRKVAWLYYTSIILLLLWAFLYFCSNRAILGTTKNNIVFIKLHPILFRSKEVNEIPVLKIRFLDVKHFKIFNYVKISFIDNTGKFRKLKFMYTPIVLGFDIKMYSKNSREITNRLDEIQKVLDKGDF